MNREYEDCYFTASDGNRIHYIVQGTGRTVLFPHGFGCCAADHLPQFARMPEGFRCISFDQRGYGSTLLTENAGLFQSAKDLHELIEHIGEKKVAVVGYSMGAAVTFAYIRQYGCEYLERVVIGDMSPKVVNDEEWKLGLYQGWYTWEDVEKDTGDLSPEETEARNLYFMQQLLLPHTPEESRRCIRQEEDPEGYAALKAQLHAGDRLTLYSEGQLQANRYYTRSMGEADFRADLGRISVPVLLVYAVPGSLYHEGVARYMEAHVPNGKLVFIRDAVHGLTDAQTEEYIKEIVDFMKETSRHS